MSSVVSVLLSLAPLPSPQSGLRCRHYVPSQHVTAALVHVVPEHTCRHDVPWQLHASKPALHVRPCILWSGSANTIHAHCGVGLDVVVIDGEIEKHRCHLSEEFLGTPLASEGLA